MPLSDIYCRVRFANSTVEFKGDYINNFTVGCNVTQPQPALLPNSNISVALEVSFNGGQQYLVNPNIRLFYSSRDNLTTIYPQRLDVIGNQPIKAFTGYFFDMTYKQAVAKFEYTDAQGAIHKTVVQIFSYS